MFWYHRSICMMLIMHQVLQNLEKSLDKKQNLPIYQNFPSLPRQQMPFSLSVSSQHLKCFKKKELKCVSLQSFVIWHQNFMFSIHSIPSLNATASKGTLPHVCLHEKLTISPFNAFQSSPMYALFLCYLFGVSTCQWCSGMGDNKPVCPPALNVIL